MKRKVEKENDLDMQTSFVVNKSCLKSQTLDSFLLESGERQKCLLSLLLNIFTEIWLINEM